MTGVAIHKNGEQIRIRFGAPCEITFQSNGESLDIGKDILAHNLARKCKEYYTSKVIRSLPNDLKTVEKLKKRYL